MSGNRPSIFCDFQVHSYHLEHIALLVCTVPLSISHNQVFSITRSRKASGRTSSVYHLNADIAVMLYTLLPIKNPLCKEGIFPFRGTGGTCHGRGSRGTVSTDEGIPYSRPPEYGTQQLNSVVVFSDSFQGPVLHCKGYCELIDFSYREEVEQPAVQDRNQAPFTISSRLDNPPKTRYTGCVEYGRRWTWTRRPALRRLCG